MQKQYGIIGYPLSHSFSPAYFTKKFIAEGIDAVYQPYPIADVNELTSLIAEHSIAGLNVTIPYKQQVLPLLDALDDAAAKVAAVNCIAVKDGKAKGYNTDIIGFRQSLQPLLQPHHNRALVLGTGGASLAVCFVLDALLIPYKVVSRTAGEGNITYDQLTQDVMLAHPLIINTTPLGMYPAVNEYPPIPYSYITADHLLYDLIYNPTETQFLVFGKEHGAAVKNGYEMLVLQAEASWHIWHS